MLRRLSDWISFSPIFKILSIFVAFTVFGFFPVFLASLFFKMVDYTCRLKRGFNRLLVLGSLAITIIATIIVTIIVTPSSSPSSSHHHRHHHQVTGSLTVMVTWQHLGSVTFLLFSLISLLTKLAISLLTTVRIETGSKKSDTLCKNMPRFLVLVVL